MGSVPTPFPQITPLIVSSRPAPGASLINPQSRGRRSAAPFRAVFARRDPSACAATPACVLQELRVENLLLIERAQLRLAPGLNVLTGETGAGKTVLAHALDLLLGGRARPGIVRPGAGEAYVEGAFDLSEAVRARSSASGCPPTPRRSSSPAASAPTGARAPT